MLNETKLPESSRSRRLPFVSMFSTVPSSRLAIRCSRFGAVIWTRSPRENARSASRYSVTPATPPASSRKPDSPRTSIRSTRAYSQVRCYAFCCLLRSARYPGGYCSVHRRSAPVISCRAAKKIVGTLLRWLGCGRILFAVFVRSPRARCSRCSRHCLATEKHGAAAMAANQSIT